jgi:hypothetical protein
MSAEHSTTPPPGRSAWYAAGGIDDGREPWAETIDAEEFPTHAAATQWAEQAIRSRRALERLRHTQGTDGNEPLLVATLEQVDYRPVAYDHPAYGPLVDTDREPVDGTQATAYLHADHHTVTWDEPERGHQAGDGGRAR